MRIHEITEARKNPKQNPKVPINDVIDNRVEKDGADNLFISFTSIDKLGINPNSSYETPLGIYAYPISYVINTTNTTDNMNNLPFAGEEPYANIFSATGNIVDLDDITDSNLAEYYKRLTHSYIKIKGISPGSSEWKTTVDMIEHVIDEAPQGAKFNTPPGRFWYVARELATKLYSTKPTKEKVPFANNAANKAIADREKNLYISFSTSWNKLFRTAGFDGFVDHGNGIIHTSEPHQAVFFSKRSIQNIERAVNKYSLQAQSDGVQLGDDIKWYKSLDPEEQFKYLEYYPEFIKYMKNQSEEAQEYIVNMDGAYIQFIENPTEYVQKLALFGQPEYIKFIKNPTETVQLEVVKAEPTYIKFIKNPTEKVTQVAKAAGVI